MANQRIIKENSTVVIPFITRDEVSAGGRFHLRVAIKKDGKSVYCEQLDLGNYGDIRWSINHSFPEYYYVLINQVRSLQRYYDNNHTLGLFNTLHLIEAERNAYGIWDAHHGFGAVSPKQKEKRHIINATA